MVYDHVLVKYFYGNVQSWEDIRNTQKPFINSDCQAVFLFICWRDMIAFLCRGLGFWRVRKKFERVLYLNNNNNTEIKKTEANILKTA